VYAIAIGLSRVYLGYHWLSDVVGAWLLGLAWLAVVIVAHRLVHAYAKRARPDRTALTTGSVSAPGKDPVAEDPAV
jgi:undecaprenyl-diphosphatase